MNIMQTIFGIPVIVSPHCYTTKVVVRGIADSRRPNNKKPFYRKVVIQVPHIIMTSGMIVVHPSTMAKLEAAVKEINDIPASQKWYDAMNVLGYNHKKTVEDVDRFNFRLHGGIPPRLIPPYYTGGA